MTEPMRGLTVREPWGSSIVYLGKSPETRRRNIAGSWRGLVAIHTSRAQPDDAEYIRQAIASPWFQGEELKRYPSFPPTLGMIGPFGGVQLITGHVIGVAELVDVHPGWTEPEPCTPWAQRYDGRHGLHHLVLRDPRRLARPIPWRGQLNLWRVPAELEARIREQVAA